MTSVITLKNMVASIPNAPVFANIPDALKTDLKGYYWLASGEGQVTINGNPVDVRAIDYSGNGNHLTKVGAPVYHKGYTRVGQGNGFNTGIQDSANLTLMVAMGVASAELSTGVAQTYSVGNYNTTSPIYGASLFAIEREDEPNEAINYRARLARRTDVDTYTDTLISPSATDTSTPFNKAYTNRTELELLFLVLNASNNTLQFYQPRVQATPRNTADYSATDGLSGRLLTKPVGGAPVPLMIGAMDELFGNTNFNTAVALAGFWSKPLSQSEVNTIYAVAKQQLQGINGTTGRYASL